MRLSLSLQQSHTCTHAHHVHINVHTAGPTDHSMDRECTHANSTDILSLFPSLTNENEGQLVEHIHCVDPCGRWAQTVHAAATPGSQVAPSLAPGHMSLQGHSPTDRFYNFIY